MNEMVFGAGKSYQKQQLAALDTSISSNTTGSSYTLYNDESIAPPSAQQHKPKVLGKSSKPVKTSDRQRDHSTDVQTSSDHRSKVQSKTAEKESSRPSSKRSESFRGREEQKTSLENRTPRRTRSRGSQRGKRSASLLISTGDDNQASQTGPQSKETKGNSKRSHSKGNRRGKRSTSELVLESHEESTGLDKKKESKSNEREQTPKRSSSRGSRRGTRSTELKLTEEINSEYDRKNEDSKRSLDVSIATPKRSRSSLFASLTPKSCRSDDGSNHSSFLSSYFSLTKSKSSFASTDNNSFHSALVSMKSDSDDGESTDTSSVNATLGTANANNKNLRASLRTKLKRSKSDNEIESVSETSNTSETLYALDLNQGKAKPSFFNSVLNLDIFGSRKKDASDKDETPERKRPNPSDLETKPSAMKREGSKKSMHERNSGHERKSSKHSDKSQRRGRSRSRGRRHGSHDLVFDGQSGRKESAKSKERKESSVSRHASREGEMKHNSHNRGDESDRKVSSKSKDRQVSSRCRNTSHGKKRSDSSSSERSTTPRNKRSSDIVENDHLKTPKRKITPSNTSQSPLVDEKTPRLESLLNIKRCAEPDGGSIGTVSLETISIDDSLDMKMKEANAKKNSTNDASDGLDSSGIVVSENDTPKRGSHGKRPVKSSNQTLEKSMHRSRSKGSKRGERSTDLVLEDTKKRTSTSRGSSRGKRTLGPNFVTQNGVHGPKVGTNDDGASSAKAEMGATLTNERAHFCQERARSRERAEAFAHSIIGRQRSRSRGSRRDNRTSELVLSDENKELEQDANSNDEANPYKADSNDASNPTVSPQNLIQPLVEIVESGQKSNNEQTMQEVNPQSRKTSTFEVKIEEHKTNLQRAKSSDEVYDHFFRDRSRRTGRTPVKPTKRETSESEIVPLLSSCSEQNTQQSTLYELSDNRRRKRGSTIACDADKETPVLALSQHNSQLRQSPDENGDFIETRPGESIKLPGRSGSRSRSNLSSDILEQVDVLLKQASHKEETNSNELAAPHKRQPNVSLVSSTSVEQRAKASRAEIEEGTGKSNRKGCESDVGASTGKETWKDAAILAEGEQLGGLSKSLSGVNEQESRFSKTLSENGERRRESSNAEAATALAKLLPSDIQLDAAMIEHLVKAAAELHAARSGLDGKNVVAVDALADSDIAAGPTAGQDALVTQIAESERAGGCSHTHSKESERGNRLSSKASTIKERGNRIPHKCSGKSERGYRSSHILQDKNTSLGKSCHTISAKSERGCRSSHNLPAKNERQSGSSRALTAKIERESRTSQALTAKSERGPRSSQAVKAKNERRCKGSHIPVARSERGSRSSHTLLAKSERGSRSSQQLPEESEMGCRFSQELPGKSNKGVHLIRNDVDKANLQKSSNTESETARIEKKSQRGNLNRVKSCDVPVNQVDRVIMERANSAIGLGESKKRVNKDRKDRPPLFQK